MRKISIILLLASLASYLHAQNFEIITDPEAVSIGKIGENLSTSIKIKNITDRPIYIFVDRVEKVIGSTQTTNFCWGDDCYDESVERMPLSKKINPGETSEAFVSVLESGLVEGFSTVKYNFYTRSNRNDVVSHEVTYSIESDQNSQILFSSSSLVFNEIYPNPVREYAIVNYKVINPDTEAKVLLHNVLGSIVGIYELIPLEQVLKIDTKELNSGVYFYTLFIDGNGILTKKLIIRE